MSSSSSWKKYGGINKLDKMNYLNVNSIVTDTMTLREAYVGTFDICGNVTISEKLSVNGKTTFNNDIYVTDNVDISKNVIIDGNITVNGDSAFTNAQSTFFNKLYLGSDNKQYFYGDPSGVGINIEKPNATLDICGNRVEVLNVFSNLSTNRNIIARNMNNKGIVVSVDNINSTIDFFNDASINPVNTFDGRIQYQMGGVLTIDVSDNTYVASKISVSNRDVSGHVMRETAVIYDICNNTYAYNVYDASSANTGNALSLIALDNSSNTFLNIVTPGKNGLSIGGGAYPLDREKAMGTIGLYDASSNIYIPTQNIVRGSSSIKYKSTLGINTHCPRIDNYVVDINGPVHLTNGELTTVSSNNFEIKNFVFSRANKEYGIAFGSPYSISTGSYKQKILYTKNGGKSWSESRIADNFGQNGHITDLEQQDIDFYSGYIYNQNYSIIGGDSNYLFYSNDGGQKWNNIAIADGYNLPVVGVYIGESGNVNTDYKRFIILYYNRFSIFDVSLNGLNANMATNTSIVIPASDVSNNSSGIGIEFNNMHGYGNYVYMVGTKILKYNINTKQFINSATHDFLTGSLIREYNSVYAYDNNYVIAVGDKIISYTKNGGTNWTNISTNTPDLAIQSITLQAVYILDASYAMAVGNNGVIIYTTNGSVTWKTAANDVINSSGNGNRIVNYNYNLNGIIMQDINSFIVSTLIKQHSSNQELGKTNIIYGFLPNLMNRVNNYVFDVSGNMGIDGDIRINNGTIMVKDTTASTSTSSGALQISGGAGIVGNTYIGGNLIVNSSAIANDTNYGALHVPYGGASIGGNVNIGGNTEIINNLTVRGVLHTYSDVITTGQSLYNSDATFSSGTPALQTLLGQSTRPVQGSILVTNGGGMYVSGNTYIGGDWADIDGNASIKQDLSVLGRFLPNSISVVGTEAANNLDEGAFKVVNGGASIKGNTYIGGNLILSYDSTVQGTSYVSGAATFNDNIYVNGNISFNNIENSTSYNNGALVIAGGVGIGGSTNINGNSKIYSTIQSYSITTGAFVVNGGVGIGKNIFVGGDSYTAGFSNITGNCNITGNTNATGNIIISNTNNTALQISNGGLYIGGTFAANNGITGALQIPNGGASINGNLFLGGNISVGGGAVSANTISGALVVTGGAGISGNTNIGGNNNVTGISNLTGNINLAGIAKFNNATASTDTGNGSLVVYGGVGIGGAINVGTTAKIAGITTITNNTPSGNTTSGALVVTGGFGIGGNINAGNNVNVSGNTTISSGIVSTSTGSGALIVTGTGGVGIGGNMHIGGTINVTGVSNFTGNINLSAIANFNNGTTSSAVGNGALVVVGGVGIGKDTTIGGIVKVTNTTSSTFAGDGAMVVSGGVGITGTTNIGGITKIINNTASSDSSNGAFIVTGGVGVGGNINIGSLAKFAGITTVTNNTTSSASYNGAFVVTGGVGIGGTINAGSSVNINGITNIANSTASSDTNNGALVVSGGVGIGGATYIGGIANIVNGTPSSASWNGALVVNGGVGIGGSINIGGITNIANNTQSNATNNGALIVTGGVGIGGSTYIGGIANITNGTASSATNNGALVVSGGVGIGGSTYIGGIANIVNGTASSASNNGALVVNGGVGIGGAINIGGTAIINGITTITNGTTSSATNNGALIVSGGVGIGGTINVGGITKITNGTTSSATNNGALVVSGGVGIGGNINVGGATNVSGAANISGITKITNDTTSSATNNGALVVSGGVGIGGTINVGSTASIQGITYIKNSTASSAATNGALVVSGGVGVAGTVNATTFNATSDYRIKENVKRLDDSFSVDKLEPVSYYNTLSKRHDIGFIAHKVQELYPYLVNGEKDSANYQTLNYIGLIGILVREVQELKKTVHELTRQ